MLKVTIVVGNPKPQSRTRQIAEQLVAKVLHKDSYQLEVIDLADHADHLFLWPSDRMTELNRSVASSNLIIVASPTYKATYTGLLKAFLDRYPANGLNGVIAIPLMTGADLAHSLGPSTSLAPLLAELGAIVPMHGAYFVTAKMDHLDEFVEQTAKRFDAAISAIVPILEALAIRSDLAGEKPEDLGSDL